MKLLFDANVSYRVVKLLKAKIPDCLHVNRSGLAIPIKDIDIWQYARQNGFTIVTNDEDFLHLESIYGFPPKVIHLRLGNSSTRAVAQKIETLIESINIFIHSEQYGVLEVF